MTDSEIIKQEFERNYTYKYKPYDELQEYFDSETKYNHYFKKVLYFTKTVIQPLEKKGLNINDSIVDVASGDGQMSLALILLGYKDITLFDLDAKRLDFGIKLIQSFCPDATPKKINDSATNLNIEFDVLISYQTIEHLSDEGNYSIAKKKCQIEFLKKINTKIKKLCYFNAPNRSFPIDGHDTGKLFFHYLPIRVKAYLINKKIVTCSWTGICRPVSISFLNKHLTQFKLCSKYYAFDNMLDYLNNYPAFDYMGSRVLPVDTNSLSTKKKIINRTSLILGKQTQKLLPVLSVIYIKKI